MRVYAVGEVGAYLQDVYSTDEVLSDLWVTGEITSFSRAASGHFYFNLKDDEGQLRSVMWRSYANRVAMTPRAGDAVIARIRCAKRKSCAAKRQTARAPTSRR